MLESSFQQSLGALFSDFYTDQEIAILENEIKEKLENIRSKGSEESFQSIVYEPGPEDPLLRIRHICFLAVFPALPFFSARIRRYLSRLKMTVNRSLHFHPKPGYELLYCEAPDSERDVWRNAMGIWQEEYGRIQLLTKNFVSFRSEERANWMTEISSEGKDLWDWLIEKAFVWEGTILQRESGEIVYGEIATATITDWFYSLPNVESKELFVYGKESQDPAFLGEGEYFGIAFVFPKGRALLVGSLNEYARGQALTDIPYFREKFRNFLTSTKIELSSGIGRTSRLMFNYLPTELLFLIPPEKYSDLHKALMEQSLRNGLGSLSIPFSTQMGLIAIFVPDGYWNGQTWKKALQHIKEVFPRAEVRQYEVFRGNRIEGFAFIRDSEIYSNRLFDTASRMEQEFIPWEEFLFQRLEERSGNEWNRLDFYFSPEYKTAASNETAVSDILHWEQSQKINLSISVYFTYVGENFVAHVLSPKGTFSLSRWVELWGNLGLEPKHESFFDWSYKGVSWEKTEFSFLRLPDIGKRFVEWEKAVLSVLMGDLVCDPLLHLLTITHLSTDSIAFLCAMREYLLQTNPIWNPKETNETLLRYPKVSILSFKRFENKFLLGNNVGEQELFFASTEGQTLREDEVLRAFASIIESILRTNYFGTKLDKEKRIGHNRPYLSFKIDSTIPVSLPDPRPYREIFVYAPNFQGVHLRGGKVARGGLRFSDRTADYRTEVLSLWKTQTVKNSVIVPVGSKGCFVLTPHSFQKRPVTMVEAYKDYVRGLLSLTDNLIGGENIRFSTNDSIPYAKEETDPYLVVAADKGTASLSDTANALSEDLNFWLGDAFASGGSRGYSHKELGITAKGALVTADRNFRMIGKDFHSESIQVVGIGDLGGDVFGNGLIESKNLILVGAFNHKHIFLDPNPNLETSFEERKRLFYGPIGESGWNHYNLSKISEGGGVFLRSEKNIQISPQIQAVLGISESHLSGQALVSAILKAPVDLLYNGGIGTYVKSSLEENFKVGDPANNDVRINANELRVKVVSEGGNLGFTQSARIEFDQAGGLIFTDALDNSAGVDLSDHEVNLKILCSNLIEKGVMAKADRDIFLKEISSEVVTSVLLDNAYQCLSVNIDRIESEINSWTPVVHALNQLIQWKKIKPTEHGIPESAEVWKIWKAKNSAIPRPVLVVLLSHAKMALYDFCLTEKTFLPHEFNNVLNSYFPESAESRFSSEFLTHPLSLEIVTTQVVNFYFNLLGVTGINLLDSDPSIVTTRFKKILLFLYEKEIHLVFSELAAMRSVTLEIPVMRTIISIREKIREEFQELRVKINEKNEALSHLSNEGSIRIGKLFSSE